MAVELCFSGFIFACLVFDHFFDISLAAANQKWSLQRQRTALSGDIDDTAGASLCEWHSYLLYPYTVSYRESNHDDTAGVSLCQFYLLYPYYRESNPENIMVSCGAQRVNADTPSPMDPDEVRLQATEVIQHLAAAHLSIFVIFWKVLRHENFRWLTAHTPILGENNGHPSGLGLFENDIAIVKVNGTLPCKKKEIWPACLPTPVSITTDNMLDAMFDNRTVTDEKACVDFRSFKTLRFESTYFQFLSCRALTMRAGQKLGWQVGVWPRDGRIICQPGQGFRVTFIFFIIDFRLGSNQERWACRTFPPTDESQRSNCCRRLLRKEGDTPLFHLSLSCAQVCHVSIGPIGIQNCVITDTKICAGGVPDRGPCRGDSGGALVAQDNDLQGWSAVGLVSYQPGNILEWPECGSDKFTVFTEVSKWVQNPDEKSLFEKERREALWTNQCALWRYVFFRYLGWIANQFNLDPPLS